MKRKEKITLSSFAGENPAEQLLTYIFEAIMPKEGYALRESQFELSKKILSSLMLGKTALCEAEVGTGKTHAYLIAALVYRLYLKKEYENSDKKSEAKYRRPITVATASISLQKSIVEEYIPSISNMLMKYGIIDAPLEVAVRKGKEHYICDERLRNYSRNLRDSDKSVLPVLKKALTYHWSNIDIGNISEINRYTKSMINVPRSCSDVFCKRYGGCRYCLLKSYFESERVDIQVTNINYYLADAMRRKDNMTPLLSKPCAVIFDEAHMLADAARTMYGKSLSNMTAVRISEYIGDLHVKDSSLSKTLYNDSEQLIKLNDNLFSRLLRTANTKSADDGAERFAVSMEDRQ